MKELSGQPDLSVLTVSGKTLEENPKRAEAQDPEVTCPLKDPNHEEGGIFALKGNLAPAGAVVKQSGVKPKMMVQEGPVRFFHRMEGAVQSLMRGEAEKRNAIVLRYEGPKVGAGMRKVHIVALLREELGLDESCSLLIHGRFSDSSRGPCSGHISPEAMEGDPIALAEDQGLIRVHIRRRELTLKAGEKELARRRKALRPLKRKEAGILGRYVRWAGSAGQGSVLGRISQT